MNAPNCCRHLRAAWAQARPASADPTVETNWTVSTRWLCAHAESAPERYLNLPRWLVKEALAGGPAFELTQRCAGCPCYSEGQT